MRKLLHAVICFIVAAHCCHNILAAENETIDLKGGQLYVPIDEKIPDDVKVKEVIISSIVGKPSVKVKSYKGLVRLISTKNGMLRDYSQMNLNTLNLVGNKLTAFNFAHSTLDGTVFDRSMMIKCKLDGASSQNASFIMVPMQYSSLVGVIFTGVKFEKTNLDKCNFTIAKFTNCIFLDCTMKQSNFTDVKFTDCSFRGTDISGSNFKGSKFIKCDFPEIVISTATNFRSAVLVDMKWSSHRRKLKRRSDQALGKESWLTRTLSVAQWDENTKIDDKFRPKSWTK